MIFEWLGQSVAVLVAAAVFFLPGLMIGSALRVRGLALAALAPVGSVAILSLGAIIFGALGIPWAPTPIVCLTAAGTALALIGGRALPPPIRHSSPRPTTLLLIVGVTIGAVLNALRLILYIGEPEAISQTNDAVFHLNALRWVLDTGSASSFDVSGVIGGRGFYPGAWHAMTSAVVLFSGAAVPVAANAVSIVIAALIWPLGIAWLTRAALRGSAAGALGSVAPPLAATLSAGLLVFPTLMFQWGVLYPYAQSLALAPAAAAVVLTMTDWVGSGRRTARIAQIAILAVAGVGAIALSQPAVLLVWGALVTVWFAGWAFERARGVASVRSAVALYGAAVAAIVALAILWIVLAQSTSGSHWPPFEGKVRAALDVVVNGQLMLPPALVISALMAVGAVVAARRGALRWLVAVWMLFAGLYWLSAAVGNPWVRQWLLGAWYADPYRLAALASLAVVPLAAVGLSAAVLWAANRFRRPGMRRSALGAVSLAIATAVVLIPLIIVPVVQMPKVIEAEWDDQTRYESNDRSFLSPDERLLLERLGDTVPEDALIIGNPSTGTGFGYMLSGRTVYPRTWASPRSDEWWVLAEHLRDVESTPEVCDALETYGSPQYVLDFGPGEQSPGRYLMPGFTDFEGQTGFRQVDRQGDASLWEITACAP